MNQTIGNQNSCQQRDQQYIAKETWNFLKTLYLSTGLESLQDTYTLQMQHIYHLCHSIYLTDNTG
jgi:hypothetical protein